MNCNTFNDRLEDLIEENISYDLKSAMMTHMENCKECSEIYRQEIKIERDFKIAYSTEGIVFKSCRQDILKQIDGERYSKNKGSKFASHLKEYGKAYAGIAAIILAFLVFGTLIQRRIGISAKSSASMPQSISNRELQTGSSASSSMSDLKNDANAYKITEGIKFTMESIPKDSSISAVEWKKSPDNDYSACVEGGPLNVDFGIRKIYLKNLKNNKLTGFSINQTASNQNTPMFLEWWSDSKYILIILGNAYGTASKGGSVYALDISTGIAYNVYTAAYKEQVKDIKVGNAGVTCDILVYDDKNFTKYHTISYYISQKEISLILDKIKAAKP